MKELVKVLVLTALVFIIALGCIVTASGQSLTQCNDSLIHYTDKQDKKCLECLINSPKKDSLISNYTKQVYNLKLINKNNHILVTDLTNSNKEKDEANKKISLHLVRSRRLTKVSLIGGIGVGLIGGILLNK